MRLCRLQQKDDEWRAQLHAFNQVWREANERHYLKALDHQAQVCKQSDAKLLRSRTLINHIETLYDEVERPRARPCAPCLVRVDLQRRERAEAATGEATSGPHCDVVYPHSPLRAVIYDVADLLIHHVKRQASQCTLASATIAPLYQLLMH